MSTLPSAFFNIKEQINCFIIDCLMGEPHHFTVEKNEKNNNTRISCFYTHHGFNRQSISVNYFEKTGDCYVRTSHEPEDLRKLALVCMIPRVEEKILMVKDALQVVLDQYTLGKVNLDMKQLPYGSAEFDKMGQRYFKPSVVVQGKIAFDRHLHTFDFINANIKSIPLYYFKDDKLLCSLFLAFGMGEDRFSIPLRDDDDFNFNLVKCVSTLKENIKSRTIKTVSKKFLLNPLDGENLSDMDLKNYISVMSMEAI